MDRSVRVLVKEYFQLEKCLYCIDKLNQFADISFGDNYTGQNGRNGDLGSSSVIIRTQNGNYAFENILPLSERFVISIDDIAKSQKINERIVNLSYAKLSGKVQTITNSVIQTEDDNKTVAKSYSSRLNKIAIGKSYTLNKKSLESEISRILQKRRIRMVIRVLKRKIFGR